MTTTSPEENKALVLKAFDTLFNKRDYIAAERFWSDRYHRRDMSKPTDVRNVLRYVLLNTQKHHRVIGSPLFPESLVTTGRGQRIRIVGHGAASFFNSGSSGSRRIKRTPR